MLPPTRTSTGWDHRRDLLARLDPVRPALATLGLATPERRPSTAGAVYYYEGEVVIVGERSWADEESMVMMALDQALALYDEGYSLERQAREQETFDGALAIVSAWVGAADIQAELVRSALRQEAYRPSGSSRPVEAEALATGSAIDAWPDVHGRGSDAFYLRQDWTFLGAAGIDRLLRDPPGSTFELRYHDEVPARLYPERLSTLTEPLEPFESVASAALGSSVARLFATSIGLQYPPTSPDRLYRLRQVAEPREAALWVIGEVYPDGQDANLVAPSGLEVRIVAGRMLVAASPDPQLRAALLQLAGEITN